VSMNGHRPRNTGPAEGAAEREGVEGAAGMTGSFAS